LVLLFSKNNFFDSLF